MRTPRLKRYLQLGSIWTVAFTAAWVASGAASAEARPGPLVGKTAPAFRVEGIFHETYSLETFKGHILVMQFGTSW